MKIAVIGSRNLRVDISKYIPAGTTEIISGGARGIDTLAEKYADENNIPKLIFKPEYEKYGKSAPLRRNKTIVEKSDIVVAICECVKLRPTKKLMAYVWVTYAISLIYVVLTYYERIANSI